MTCVATNSATLDGLLNVMVCHTGGRSQLEVGRGQAEAAEGWRQGRRGGGHAYRGQGQPSCCLAGESLPPHPCSHRHCLALPAEDEDFRGDFVLPLLTEHDVACIKDLGCACCARWACWVSSAVEGKENASRRLWQVCQMQRHCHSQPHQRPNAFTPNALSSSCRWREQFEVDL